MEIRCGNCGHKTIVTISLIRSVLGGGLLTTGAVGWVTYAFAGVLGFHGGAALIAMLLLTGGASVLVGKDLNLTLTIADKITDILNKNGYRCGECGAASWQFTGIKNAEVIVGYAHKEELWKALENASKELYIASGFLSSNVVNEYFIHKLESVLIKKVSVYLIFSDERSHNTDMMMAGFRNAYSQLSKLADKYNHLRLIQSHTHQKGIVVDDRYAITGSFNFLSNKNVTRKETSLKVYESKAISKFRQELLEN